MIYYVPFGWFDSALCFMRLLFLVEGFDFRNFHFLYKLLCLKYLKRFIFLLTREPFRWKVFLNGVWIAILVLLIIISWIFFNLSFIFFHRKILNFNEFILSLKILDFLSYVRIDLLIIKRTIILWAPQTDFSFNFELFI